MSKRKGYRTKKKAQKYYQERDWAVDDCEKGGRFIKNKDLFNLFDLVAVKGCQVLFIQVKTNRPAGQKEFQEWADKHCNESIRCVVWTWYDRDGPRIQEYKSSGEIEERDLRKSKNSGEKLWEV